MNLAAAHAVAVREFKLDKSHGYVDYINIDVRDARIRELHVPVRARQIMLARPIFDL